jgi:hypothetical protein
LKRLLLAGRSRGLGAIKDRVRVDAGGQGAVGQAAVGIQASGAVAVGDGRMENRTSRLAMNPMARSSATRRAAA